MVYYAAHDKSTSAHAAPAETGLDDGGNQPRVVTLTQHAVPGRERGGCLATDDKSNPLCEGISTGQAGKRRENVNHIWVIEVSTDDGATWSFFATRGNRVDARETAKRAKLFGFGRPRIVKFVRVA